MKNIRFKKNRIWIASDKFVGGKVEIPLERCPFCGEAVYMEFSVNKSSDYAYVEIYCVSCKASNFRARDKGKTLYGIADELSEAWNRRA